MGKRRSVKLDRLSLADGPGFDGVPSYLKFLLTGYSFLCRVKTPTCLYRIGRLGLE